MSFWDWAASAATGTLLPYAIYKGLGGRSGPVSAIQDASISEGQISDPGQPVVKDPVSQKQFSDNSKPPGLFENRDSYFVPNYEKHQAAFEQGAANAQTRTAPQMQAARMDAASMRAADIDGAQQAQFRGQQNQLASMLMRQAQGQGPSLAQMQHQQASDNNLRQAMAMAQSTRGAGAAGAARQVANQRAAIGQQMAADSGMMRLQEQMQAQGLLGQVAGAARGQDIGLATSQAQLQQAANQTNASFQQQASQANAGFQQQASQSNAGFQLQQQAANDDMVRYYTSQGMNLDMARMQAAQDMDRLRANYIIGQASDATQRNAQTMQLIGAGAQGVGTLAMAMSDEKLKTDVKPAGKKLYELLEATGAHEYRYKNPAHGTPRISAMAQELEKSELGRQFVVETPVGKAVDYGKGLGTMLASQAELHRRLKKLEGK